MGTPRCGSDPLCWRGGEGEGQLGSSGAIQELLMPARSNTHRGGEAPGSGAHLGAAARPPREGVRHRFPGQISHVGPPRGRSHTWAHHGAVQLQTQHQQRARAALGGLQQEGEKPLKGETSASSRWPRRGTKGFNSLVGFKCSPARPKLSCRGQPCVGSGAGGGIFSPMS